MFPEISLIGRLEALDEASHRLQARLAELPKILTAEKKTVEEKKRHLDATRGRQQANDGERRARENAVAQHQSKLTKLRKQLDAAASEAQVQAFEHEIAFATNAIATGEDEILTLLLEAESLTAEIEELEKAHAAAHKQAAANFRSAEQEHKTVQQTLAGQAGERAAVEGQLSPAMAQLYAKLRKRYKSGPIVAETDEGRCGVCQIEMRLAFWQKMQNEPDVLYQCEECGRILVCNKPVSPVEG